MNPTDGLCRTCVKNRPKLERIREIAERLAIEAKGYANVHGHTGRSPIAEELLEALTLGEPHL